LLGHSPREGASRSIDFLTNHGVTGNVFQGGGVDKYGGQSAATHVEFSCWDALRSSA